jgi:ribosome maturation factor RimP
LYYPDYFIVELTISLTGENRPGKVAIAIEKAGGIDLESCITINRQLRAWLETGPYPDFTQYQLEVASPGVGEPLRVQQQYPNQIGRILQLHLTDGQSLRAKLAAVTLEGISVLPLLKGPGKHRPVVEAPTPLQLGWHQISEARVEVSFNQLNN